MRNQYAARAAMAIRRPAWMRVLKKLGSRAAAGKAGD